jgi:AraC-like DNA-binding protein
MVTRLKHMSIPAPDDTRGIIDPAEMMRLVDFARYPAGDVLDGIVDWFWSVSWAMPDGVVHRQQVLNLPGGNISIGTVDDTGPLEEPGGRIYGVLTGISHRLLTGAGWTVAAKTTTGGLGVLLDASARTATGRELALSRIPGLDDPGCGGALVCAVTEASTQAARVDLLRTALDGVARRRDPAAMVQAREVARIARIAETDRSVLLTEQLADAAGVSVRTLQRLFSDHVGVSPAWVIRRWRIIEAAERARDAGDPTWPGWADLAVELGYSDQSHLVRDMRRHLGTTPTGYVNRQPAPA